MMHIYIYTYIYVCMYMGPPDWNESSLLSIAWLSAARLSSRYVSWVGRYAGVIDLELPFDIAFCFLPEKHQA